MNVMRLLNAIAKEVSDNVNWVNHGGCCVFASLVASRLAPIVPKMRIAVIDYDGLHTNIDDVRNDIDDKSNIWEWTRNGVSFNHVIIEIFYEGQYRYFDSDGVKESFSSNPFHTLLEGALTIKEAVTFASDRSAWNPRFNRDQIPTMMKIIDDIFDAALWQDEFAF